MYSINFRFFPQSDRDNFGKLIYQFQPETKTLIRKHERILNKFPLQLTELVRSIIDTYSIQIKFRTVKRVEPPPPSAMTLKFSFIRVLVFETKCNLLLT